MTISKPLFIYLQRPDSEDWVTVGRYQAGPGPDAGRFRYAPSYADAGLAWPIRFDISRAAVLADAYRFGFDGGEDAALYLDRLLERIRKGFNQVAHWLDEDWRGVLHGRMLHNIGILKPAPSS